MDNSPSVRTLIFSAHVQRLKELLSKLPDESITNEELRELAKLHIECIEMSAHVVEEANRILLEANLIPDSDTKEMNELLHKIKESNKGKKYF
ncbi:hypothetical protein EI976_05095 [Bacillus licheniformis]|uniref:Uncharacterized protein n=1 Tax=Bacillus glycinifermentans TaxID=1664069 RepID=A0AAJ3YXU9_9BACI|nr:MULTISPECIES: hypothetical protein [Bacillus]AYC51994.1 hypothetical protein C7M53_12100 [Bacillus licheniformis]KAA0813129.1 hypothetical protein EI978_08215 [Bacillus licheniformis]KAA0821318.1 hypothetical protein EI973_19225 [Bacillus licheniformis]KAA0826422.1 hypothetical protein EI976_05095 [Bacillus licheniformis]MBU8781527.1 hypothetical protein [Bacillus licheniformis]